jgi:hypothetical protein
MLYFFVDNMGFVKQLRAGVVFVDEITKLSIGKIDRKYFKQLVSNEVIKKIIAKLLFNRYYTTKS